MGVLPLQFKQGENADTLGLTGKEVIEVDVDETVRPRDLVTVRAINEDRGRTVSSTSTSMTSLPVKPSVSAFSPCLN